MGKKLFLTRIETDLGNSYLYAYSQETFEAARRRSGAIIDGLLERNVL